MVLCDVASIDGQCFVRLGFGLACPWKRQQYSLDGKGKSRANLLPRRIFPLNMGVGMLQSSPETSFYGQEKEVTDFNQSLGEFPDISKIIYNFNPISGSLLTIPTENMQK